MTDERTITETPIAEIVDRPMGARKTNVIMDSQILTSLMGCPRLSDFRFNMNLISLRGKSNSLECGSIVHKFLEVYYGSIIKGLSKDMAAGHGLAAARLYIQSCKHCTDFQPHTVDDPTRPGVIIEVNKPICGHKPNDYPGVKNTPKDSEGYKVGWQYVLDTCEQYLEYYRNDHWIPLEVETVKGKQIYEDNEIRIIWKAKFDWIVDTNQGIYPVDHKSMKQNRSTLNLNNQFSGQALLMGTRGVVMNKVGFQKTLEPKEKFVRPMVNYTAARLLEWQSVTVPYWAKMLLMFAESGHWPENYTHCESKYGNCAFINVCTDDPENREQVLKNEFVVGPAWDIANEDELMTGDE